MYKKFWWSSKAISEADNFYQNARSQQICKVRETFEEPSIPSPQNQ